MRKLRSRAGLSLVEVTIMLLVLMLLAGVLAPSIMDFVHDARWVKVKEDCEAIGVSVARMMRDVPPCLRLVGTDACTVDNRVDLLWSDGTTAGAISPTSSAATNYTLAGGNATGPLNWDANITAQDGSMEQHMVRNDILVPYPLPHVLFPLTVPVGPQTGIGWRGAYLSADRTRPSSPSIFRSTSCFISRGGRAVRIATTPLRNSGCSGRPTAAVR